MAIIEMKQFSKKFGHKRIFDHFNLSIEKGEMVALTGKSGSGKTTLLNVFGLIEPIEQGEYRIFGKKAPKINSKQSNQVIREKISYLFQNFALVDNLSVEENLLMALKYVPKTISEKQKIIAHTLEKVGLKDYQKLKIFEISGGEQQRVAIARAMMKPSEIILADEPTGALDGQNRDEVLNLLHELNKEGKTIVIVTHDPHVATQCDRVIQL